MRTLSKVFQYAYLIIALVMFIEAFIEYKNEGTRVWFYIIFGVGAVGMYFFKKHFNKKFKDHSNKDS